MIRTLVTGALLVLLTACGPSAAELAARNVQAVKDRELEQMREQRAKDQADADALQKCQDDQAAKRRATDDRIRQDQNIVLTTLGGITASGQDGAIGSALKFSVEVEKLDADQWEWTEIENKAVANDEGETAGTFDRVHYVVNPANLTTTVEVTTYLGQPAVRIDCINAGCIRATGRRVAAVNDDRRLVDIDERRDRNFWALETNAKATGLADTMRDLLMQFGAVRAMVSCSPPSPRLGTLSGGAMRPFPNAPSN